MSRVVPKCPSKRSRTPVCNLHLFTRSGSGAAWGLVEVQEGEGEWREGGERHLPSE